MVVMSAPCHVCRALLVSLVLATWEHQVRHTATRQQSPLTAGSYMSCCHPCQNAGVTILHRQLQTARQLNMFYDCLAPQPGVHTLIPDTHVFILRCHLLALANPAVAANLLKAGLPVLVFDRNPAAVDKLVKLGAKAVGSPQELGETPGKQAHTLGLGMKWVLQASSSLNCSSSHRHSSSSRVGSIRTKAALLMCLLRGYTVMAICSACKPWKSPAGTALLKLRLHHATGVMAVLSMLPSTDHVADAYEGVSTACGQTCG